MDSIGTLFKCRYLNSNSFLIFRLLSKSEALSVWRMMAVIASEVVSGNNNLLVTVWARDWRSSTDILLNNSEIPRFSASVNILDQGSGSFINYKTFFEDSELVTSLLKLRLYYCCRDIFPLIPVRCLLLTETASGGQE